MLISLQSKEYVYIGETIDLHQRTRSHQSGSGSKTKHPEYLRPYAYFKYICGFDNDEILMFY